MQSRHSCHSSQQVLRVRRISGEEVTAVPVEELSTVRALKRDLQKQSGISRFRQRLLHKGTVLNDDLTLESPLELQLVLLNFIRPEEQEAEPRQERMAFFTSCVSGDRSKVEKALERPWDPNLHLFGEATALHAASWCGNTEIMELLLEAMADLDAEAYSWKASGIVTPMQLAYDMNQVDAMRLLLAARADTERPHQGRTVLWQAAESNNTEAVKVLLEAGARRDAPNVYSGMTPLAAACRAVSVAAARLLLDAGANKESADRLGATPLGSACWRGHVRVVRFLLRAGAKPTRRNSCGKIRRWPARGSGRSLIAFLLSTHRWSRRLPVRRCRSEAPVSSI